MLLAYWQRHLTSKLLLICGYATLGITLLIADTFVYQQYRFHINAMVIELFVEGGSQVISFPKAMWLKIMAIVLAIFVLQLTFAYLAKRYCQRLISPWKKISLNYSYLPYFCQYHAYMGRWLV